MLEWNSVLILCLVSDVAGSRRESSQFECSAVATANCTTTHLCGVDPARCVSPALARNVADLSSVLHGAVPRVGLHIFGIRTGTLRQVCIAPKVAVARQHSKNAALSGLALHRNSRSHRRSIQRSILVQAA